MKKILVLLPLLAGTMLCGCGEDPTPAPKCHHKDENNDHYCDLCNKVLTKCKDSNNDHYCDTCNERLTICVDEDENAYCDICKELIPDSSVPEPEEFAGYRRVLQPEDGKEYLIGMLQGNTKKMIFMNGLPHTDQAGIYDYYLECTTFDYDYENNPKGEGIDISENTVRVKTEYVDDKYFTIELVPGTSMVSEDFDNKEYYEGYFQIYGDRKDSTAYTSLCIDPNLEKTYSNKNTTPELLKDCPCSNKWYYLQNYEEGGVSYKVDAIVTDFNNECSNKNYGLQPIALGTWGTYENIEAVTTNHLVSNYKAHFWEKIEQAPAE